MDTYDIDYYSRPEIIAKYEKEFWLVQEYIQQWTIATAPNYIKGPAQPSRSKKTTEKYLADKKKRERGYYERSLIPPMNPLAWH